LFTATGTDSKAIEAPAQAAEPGARRALLTCAMAAPALYVGLDALAARLYHDYSYRDQTISELSAVGAPTRPLWVAVGSVDSLLALAGAVGTWLSAGRRPVVRAVAAMAGAVGALGLLAWPFAPMHRREVLAAGGSTGADTAHIVLAGVDSALFLAMMAIGSRALGRRFRRYSLASLAATVVCGAYTGANGPRVSANKPTPWLGAAERVAVFAPMVWTGVLAACLWRGPGAGARDVGTRS
jgi:hypothetical protein